MGYDLDNWKHRLAERSDLTTNLVHLTRGAGSLSAVAVLCKILEERHIRGSDPEPAFIHGDTPAVCFQDAPLHGIGQNVYFEQKYRENVPNAKIRYRACGLMFKKPYVFAKGGRPVIYDRPGDVKAYLPKSQWWRIVNFDLSDPENFIDWSHEREWRVPGNFDFEWDEASVLLPNSRTFRYFFLTQGLFGGSSQPPPRRCPTYSGSCAA